MTTHGRTRRSARAALLLAAALLVGRAMLPAPAHAADLFPVDDWLGAGIKGAGELVLGPLKLGASEIARLLATIVGALADLLVPKSLVRAGIDGIRWLVQLPPVGTEVSTTGAIGEVRMPHLVELRGVLTWIGLTLLPLGVVLTAGRAFLAPSADADSPGEVLQRALIAGFGLLVYDWAWGVVTRLSRLLTDALLGLPWVADGVERMLETLLIGGAAGTAVAAEFVIPLLIMAAGGALLALLLLRVGLEVVTSLVYVLGGLVLGASVTAFGRRLLAAWLVAASAVVVLPLLWSVVFVTGAALMLDADTAAGGGFAGFVAQLYNVAAALAVFGVAIKLAKGVLRQAGGAIANVTQAPASAAAGAAAGSRGTAVNARTMAGNATPAGLARFSQRVRGGVVSAGRGASFPARHPALSARAAGSAARGSVQATRAGADALRGVLTGPGGPALMDVARTRTRGALSKPGARATAAGTGQATAARTAGAGGQPLGGRRAQAAAAREARASRNAAARKDWSTPRPITGSARRLTEGSSARAQRVAGPRPWWLTRQLTPRHNDEKSKGRGDRRG